MIEDQSGQTIGLLFIASSSGPAIVRGFFLLYARAMDPLHATIEEFAAEGYTHIECFCRRCRVIRLRPMSWLPRISMGLTLDRWLVDSAVPSAEVRFNR